MTAWLVIFGFATVTYFVIAVVVAVKGFADLKDLLSGDEPGEDTPSLTGDRRTGGHGKASSGD